MTLRDFDIAERLVPLPDRVGQWLDWEEQANLIGFRTSTAPVEVEVVSIPRSQAEVHVLPGADPAILERFLRGDRVAFPRHPLNRDSTVAWFDADADERWTARFTSSRTLAMPGAESGTALFSLKLSTDHPHPDFHQPEKTKLREEAVDLVDWVGVLARIDGLLGPVQDLMLVVEILVVLAKGGETGFMVRDLRRFQDGHYYLPALSLPWVGRQIAAQHGRSFEDFWGKAYAARSGHDKAQLLARYGMWFETPNPQNLLVRLDSTLHPTDCLVFRDVGDGECATDARSCDPGIPWTRLVADLRLETTNSFWAFGEAGDHAIEADVLERWYALHDDAYFDELAAWFPGVAPPRDVAAAARLDHWNQALRSDRGVEEIVRRFEQRIRARRQA